MIQFYNVSRLVSVNSPLVPLPINMIKRGNLPSSSEFFFTILKEIFIQKDDYLELKNKIFLGSDKGYK
jgi:hypothetical protein